MQCGVVCCLSLLTSPVVKSYWVRLFDEQAEAVDSVEVTSEDMVLTGLLQDDYDCSD